MYKSDLSKDIESAECHVIGYTDQMNNAEKIVLKSCIEAFGDREKLTILCEPSLSQSTIRPPDFVLVDVVFGVHVFEVKGYKVDDILSVVAGEFEVNVQNKSKKIYPFKQVRKAMFDIKNTSECSAEQDLTIPFVYWVIFPNITRNEWHTKWKENCFLPEELIFLDDIEKNSLGKLLQTATSKRLSLTNSKTFNSDQLFHVWKSFGDSRPLYDHSRPIRKIPEDTLGSYFDEIATSYKRLSDEQQKLAMQDWTGGPRLIRGVAGSGKTIVLAANAARLVINYEKRQRSLLENKKKKILIVCYNRTLKELLREKINESYKQRCGDEAHPCDVDLDVTNMNSLFYEMSIRTNNCLWEYQPIKNGDRSFMEIQSEYYLSKLVDFSENHPVQFKLLQYDAIYVDEGQDFLENWFKILFMLADNENNRSPNLFIFYDDAQNLYGRTRPTWDRIGIKVTGRSTVMTNCFRNTREIIETAFNVLVGSFCTNVNRSLNAFADVHFLDKEKNLITKQENFWRINFASRNNAWPTVELSATQNAENENITKRISVLVNKENVNLSDILVLGLKQQRLDDFADYWTKNTSIPIHKAYIASNKDKHIFSHGSLTVSTVHSAKGYDSFYVIILSASEFSDLELTDRAVFYVGCTRAREFLLVSSYADTGMFHEFSTALARLSF